MNLTFYESAAPSMQRIDMIDNIGVNPNLASTTRNIPYARGVFQSDNLDLGFSHSPTQPLTPPGPAASLDVESGTVQRALHSFEESLRIFYEQTSVFSSSSSFYNHTAYLYVRLKAEQLAALKPCQLQVALFNEGVFKALVLSGIATARAYQSSAFFPTLTSDPATWALSNWNTGSSAAGWSRANPQQNVMALRSYFTSDQVASFVTSTAWGPLKANISNFADLAFVAGKLNLTARVNPLFVPGVLGLNASSYVSGNINWLLVGWLAAFCVCVFGWVNYLVLALRLSKLTLPCLMLYSWFKNSIDDGTVHLNDFLNWR